MKYKFKLQPYPHQLVEFKHHLKHLSSATFSETGAGKTLPILASCEARINWGIAKNVLYVCPAYLMDKILQQVSLCTNLDGQILWHQTRDKRLKLIENDVPFNIMNIEAISLYEEYLRETLSRRKYDIIVIDEAHQIKGFNSKRSKTMQRLGELAKFRIAATGTPFCRNPEDLYGLMRFVDKKVFNMPLYQFQQRYCHRERVSIGWEGDSEKSAVLTTGFKAGTESEFRSRYENIVVLHKKKDCLELPPKFIEVRRVPLAPKLQTVYRKIYKDHLIFMPDGTKVEMPNRGVQANRLAQLCSGFIQYGIKPNQKIHHFGRPGKLDALKDILEGRRDRKTVVWCTYRESVRVLEKEFEEWNPVVQMGQRNNTRARRVFQEDPECKLIITQLQINAGYELTASDCCVYYEIPQSYAYWKQSQDRQHRPGAEVHRQILYYILVTQGTVEASARVGLKRKEDLAYIATKFDPKIVMLGQMEDHDDDMPLAA